MGSIPIYTMANVQDAMNTTFVHFDVLGCTLMYFDVFVS